MRFYNEASSTLSSLWIFALLIVVYSGSSARKNEIRDFGQIGKGEGEKVSSDEIDLARGLIEKMLSVKVDLDQYENEYGKPRR